MLRPGLVTLCLAATTAFQTSSYFITIYGDVLKDKEFFTRTYPWITDNIGGHYTADFALLGSGRYSIPQMCVLTQIRGNNFLQAEYLKCEAEEKDPQVCLCNTDVDMERYRFCVQDRGDHAGRSAARYAALRINASPILEMWPVMNIHSVSDLEFLRAICRVFLSEDRPSACDNPVGGGNQTLYPSRPGVLNSNCGK